jgi:hypothetical protein
MTDRLVVLAACTTCFTAVIVPPTQRGAEAVAGDFVRRCDVWTRMSGGDTACNGDVHVVGWIHCAESGRDR